MPLITGTAGSETLNGTSGADTFDSLGGNDVVVDHQGSNTIIINFGYGSDGYQTSGSTGVSVVYPGSIYDVATITDGYFTYLPSIPEQYAFRSISLIDGTDLHPYGDLFFTSMFNALQTSDATGHTFVYSARFNGYVPTGGGPLTGAFGDTINGTAANEIFGGSELAQTINAGAGNDIVYANGGADIIFGGDGNDYISAGKEGAAANDQFYGGNDIDTISYSGMSGGVTINLTAGVAYGSLIGTDVVQGFEVAVGSLGNDVLIGTATANTMTGSFGNDYFYGYGGNDLLRGGSGIDVLIGDIGEDALFGDFDQDYLFGGGGVDTLYGGDGVDVLNDNEADNAAGIFYGGAGGDYIYAGGGADLAYGGDGNDIFVMSGTVGPGDTVLGEGGQDYFYMGEGSDQIFGGDGVDVILAAGGNDVIDAGADVDYMWLGAGSDQVIVRPGYSAEVVNEFSTSSDVIRFIGTGLTTFAAVQAAITDFGSFSIISLPDGTASVWLIGIAPDQLSASNFLFA